MAWMRTREIKPGVYETQSANRYVAGQIGIAVAVLMGLALTLMCVVALFSGSWEAIWKSWLAGGVLYGIGYWHYRYNRKHPGESRRPGPWNDGDHATSAQEAAFQAESDRLRAEANRTR